MAFAVDPYRVLGLQPGASLDQVKSAYRRLAKQYHPDFAGERALSRFLAIQQAYETLVDGEGQLRNATRGGARSAPPRGSQADADRTRATRDAYRRRRDSGGPSGAAPPGGPKRGWWAPGAGARTQDEARGQPGGPPPAGEPRRERGGTRSGPRRGSRKATPGSTSYDEVHEPFEPNWGGAGWYGPSMGTYWTLNPREYADPRKHGPEYAARARRAAPEEPATDTGAPRWGWSSTSDRADPGSRTAGGGDWAAHDWRFEDPPEQEAAPRPRPARRPTARRPAPSEPGATSSPDLETLARRLSPASLRAIAESKDLRGRAVIALIAWPPIGFVLASLLGRATGCADFGPACASPQDMAPLVAQPIIVVILALLPALAAVAAFAGLASLAAALPTAVILSAAGSPNDWDAAPGVLIGVVVAAYVVAFVAALVASRRNAQPADAAAP